MKRTGTSISTDYQQILVKHGSFYVKVFKNVNSMHLSNVQ